MKKILIAFIGFLFASCSTTHYYIVRHAEKEVQASNMSSDVPLTANGSQNAIALKDQLRSQNIRHIFSTNYIRTKATAEPLSEANDVPIAIYNPGDTSFITQLKNISQGNILVVGHSNTVGDLVNKLTGQSLLKDLPDPQYGDLFIVKKKGNKYSYQKSHYGVKRFPAIGN
ncbi:MAG TPA: histidine phosphatase family protein [Chitinophagaceae bacterium]|nr:histidine phosphatase family protein [Chitinophagaceae bacterium]